MTSTTKLIRPKDEESSPSTTDSASFFIEEKSKTGSAPVIYWATDAFCREPEAKFPNGFSDFDSFVDDLEKDPAWEAELSAARAEAAIDLYPSGPSIAQLRLKKGWSQKNLANALGTTQAQISKLENGLGNPQLSTMISLSDALEARIEDIVKILAGAMQR